MDRLVIETILADVNEVLLNSSEPSKPCILLGFSGDNLEQAKHAFDELQKLTAEKEVSLVICETLVAGMYDLEIITAALDEPVRICNKVIDREVLNSIHEKIDQNPEIFLAVKDLDADKKIKIDEATFKAHQV